MLCFLLSPAFVTKSECRRPWTAHHSARIFGPHLHAGPRSVCLTDEVHCGEFHREGSAHEWQGNSRMTHTMLCVNKEKRVNMWLECHFPLSFQSVGNKNGKLWTTDEEVSPEVLAKVTVKNNWNLFRSNQINDDYLFGVKKKMKAHFLSSWSYRCRPSSCWCVGY